jgi:hypothetical protein
VDGPKADGELLKNGFNSLRPYFERTSQTPYSERSSQTRLLAPLVRSAPLRSAYCFSPEAGEKFRNEASFHAGC